MRVLSFHRKEGASHTRFTKQHDGNMHAAWPRETFSVDTILTQVKVMWDRIFLHASSPASQWASVFLVLLELLRRAEDTLKKETRFSELIQRLVNMPFRDLCGRRGACGMVEEAGRFVPVRASV